MRQMNFDTKVDEITRKPQSHITQEDAREIQATEVRMLKIKVESQLTTEPLGPRLQQTAWGWVRLGASALHRQPQ